MSVIFIFVDGVGIGEKGDHNPLSQGWECFRDFTGTDGIYKGCKDKSDQNILFKSIDANLGVEGLPQSGTGQVTLFSGENASRKIGRHFGPFPHSKTKSLLTEKSLFKKVLDMGLQPHFMNAYPDLFFERAEKRDRWTATTLMVQSAGVRVNRTGDVVNGRAVTAEIKQDIWRERLGLDVPEITVEDAADRVLTAAKQYDLVLYEFYLTDKAGHSMDVDYADRVRQLLDPFLLHLHKNISADDTFLLTSDHGNLEDITIKTHTRNPVPLLVKGEINFFSETESIAGITPAICKLLEKGRK